ncbi:MAG: putative deoxyribonuclease YjjV [Betaproteobacteria bacterium ADurb.Bin341]|nr:MAG: putative deoxyribonuclease YjjV [Betaproteobacteria bacterium ADurb.Bin341]
MTEWIDTHCHLDAAEFDTDRDTVHAAAYAAGVHEMVIPAVDTANFEAVRACCQNHIGCLPAYGLHPLWVTRAKDQDIDTLHTWLSSNKAVAVGEIGLDFFVPGIDPVRQKRFFAAQLDIARSLNLPVLLHLRRAADEGLKYLRRARLCGGIAHAFNGSRQQADELIRLGFKLGFGGIRELATSLPLEAIVLETDAPDIPPVWLNRGRNTPAELPRIAAVLAELRGLTPEEVAVSSRAAAHSVLRIPDRTTKEKHD